LEYYEYYKYTTRVILYSNNKCALLEYYEYYKLDTRVIGSIIPQRAQTSTKKFNKLTKNKPELA